MSEEFLINSISNVGFPIVITIYMITRMEKTINKNTEMIKEVLSVLKAKCL